ncbi:MAG: YigZ family protein [Propionibacteriaceae bacterium]|jgi:uncharacterized YigZ family protein|nr:YigZ family protein [Propionibacteriaceae bacterium]
MTATIAAAVESRIEVKKSVFLGLLAPVKTVAEADAIITARRKEHYSARHHCTALIVADTQRSSDDGEPGGSAGLPMLTVLRHHELTDVLAIVTRYFGGTLLGVGGLIRAYSDAVAAAIAAATLLTYRSAIRATIVAGYDRAPAFEHLLRTWADSSAATVEAVDYAAAVTFTVLLPTPALPSLQTLLAPHPEITLLSTEATGTWTP